MSILPNTSRAYESGLPRVAVLLSTYNGERFLKEQLDGIINQQRVEVHLFARDDGSADKTSTILQEYASNNAHFRVEYGVNLGVVSSFFKLLEDAGNDFDYYAFADQDDVWMPDKLAAAVEKLHQPSKPGMYYSRLEFVDENLHPLGKSAIPANMGFHNALVQNQATGCTVVLNNAARKIVCEKLPDWALMHDWWCYLVVSAFGYVEYDSKSHILYRKHGKNVTPATPHFAVELYARTRRFLGENNIPEKVTDQAREFLRLYGDRLDNTKKALIDGFLEARARGIIGRIQYTIGMPVRRNTAFDTLIMKVLIIIGRF
jgi:glycosyltransferase involved in cell wall biosynthesis